MTRPRATHSTREPSPKDVLLELIHPPWSNRQFWATQGLVVIVCILYFLGEITTSYSKSPTAGFVWILLLLGPVVYAGVAAGIAGSLGTATFGVLLMLPTYIIFPHTPAEILGAWGLYVLAVVIAILTKIAIERSRLIAELDAATKVMDEEEQRFRLAFDNNPTAMALVDLDGYLARVNPSICQLLGSTADELIGTHFTDHTYIDDRVIANDLNDRLISGALSEVRYTKRLRSKKGDILYAEIARSLVRDRTGAPWYVITSIRDLAAERAAAQSELRFRLTFENNMAGMVLHDHNGRFLEANEAFCRLVGYSTTELAEKGSALFLYPDDAELASIDRQRVLGEGSQTQSVRRYRHRSGKIIYVEVERSTVHDEEDRPLFTITSVRDITAERTLTEQLSRQALHDPLTGLPNRTLLMDRISQAQQRVNRQGGFQALLLIDLDDFKSVNDTYGHHVGDQILVALAARLRSIQRSSDTLCRLAGDEFVYLAEDLNEVADAETLAKRIVGVLSEPFVLDNSTIERNASAGLVVWGASSKQSAIELLQAADTAMYESKRQGKARYVVYTADMGERVATSFRLVQDLAPAITNGGLSMRYQPVVNLENGQIVGWEALMRWLHPDRGWIPPETFIPLAEQNDLILKLDQFAFTQSLAQAATWPPSPFEGGLPYLAINLSARHFHDPGLLPMIENTLQYYDFPPQRLVIEITESVALVDSDATRRAIMHLDDLGIALALDDFGTGYSSLSYLAKLHPKIIKIDRSFVSPAVKGSYLQRTLEAIISLCHGLQIDAIAEGIETPGQLNELRSIGCGFGQGFLFSHAIPANEIDRIYETVLTNWERAVASL